MALPYRLERYPFPIAHPARALQTSRDSADRLERAVHLVEMTAVTAGVLVLGWSRTRGVMFDATTRWNQALERKGASLGGWIVLLRAAVPVLADHPHDPVAHALRATISDMVRCLEEFVTIRNTYAHGGKPRTHAEQNAAAKELTMRASAVGCLTTGRTGRSGLGYA